MRSGHVITRLAAANPVPAATPPRRSRPLRWTLALVAAAVIAVPAAAFAGRLGDLLGISNEGTSVPTSSVPVVQNEKLNQALQELRVGSTMQFLGTLNGTSFYASRNAAGHFCLAITHEATQYGRGVGCDIRADGFPSATVRALAFPPVGRLQGVAADGVATVALLDANGNVIASTPVTNNLFASDADVPQGQAVTLETLDASANVLSKQPLPGAEQQPRKR